MICGSYIFVFIILLSILTVYYGSPRLGRVSVLLLIAVVSVATTAFGEGPADNTPKRTIIEGVLVQISKLPKAEGNAYPDCYYTATIDIDNISTGESIEKKVVLVLPGFFSRKYAPEAKFKVGDKIRATVVPFASMPDAVKQTQQADDVEDIDLQFYFPEKAHLIDTFHRTTSPIPFVARSPKKVAIEPLHEADIKAKAAREEAIRKDLEQINKLLAEHGGDWDKWYESLKDNREKYKKEHDAKTQRWVGDSFFSAGNIDNGQLYSREFINSVVALNKYLAARNVDLILVRVPLKGEIVEDLFINIPLDEVLNPNLLKMYKELLEADVEIVSNIILRAKEQRFKFPLMYWYQDFVEDHPAEGISWVISGELAERIRRYSSVRSAPKSNLSLKKSATTTGWLSHKWPKGNPKFNPENYVQYSAVVDDNGKPLQLKQGLESPVLVLGSSYIAAPSLPKGATIPHYLAYLSGVVPDVVHRNDADFMMPRSIAREGDNFLRGRSVCLFPFVPWTPYKALASLPIFDPMTSPKTLITSYYGPTLRKAISLAPNSKSQLKYLSDGELILPGSNDSNIANLSIKLPKEVLQYPYFVLSIEFTSHDRTTIFVRYDGQTDSVKRSETQVNNEELFSFVTNPGDSVYVELKTNKSLAEPAVIKAVTIFGVKQPHYYKTSTGSLGASN